MVNLISLLINKSVHVVGPGVDIEVIAREIGENRKDKTGKIEVRGSPLIEYGSIIDVSRHSAVQLANGVNVKVAHKTSSNSYLRLYFEKPHDYGLR